MDTEGTRSSNFLATLNLNRMNLGNIKPDASLAIIMPCFNVGEYLDDAIRSVINQRASVDELVIIDDYSTDQTLTIARSYTHYEYIRVYCLDHNRGLSYARNYGASLATSDYIMFLDSDDCIHPDLVLGFKNAIRHEDLDLFAFSARGFDHSTGEANFSQSMFYRNAFKCTGRAALTRLLRENNFYSSACLYIFRHALIDWHSCGFINHLHEDEEFTPRLFLACRKLSITTKIYYLRRVRPGSIMNSKRGFRSTLGYAACLSSTIHLTMTNIQHPALLCLLITRCWYLFLLITSSSLSHLRSLLSASAHSNRVSKHKAAHL
jgi:glycosyltransferase involved in cell wall biosynthesis